MANEAVRVGGPSDNKQTAVMADATAVAVGSVIVHGNGIGTIHSSINETFLGIAENGKAASDGRLDICIAVEGDFLIGVDGTVTAGDIVCLGTTANKVRKLEITSFEKLKGVVGQALTTGTTTVIVRLW